MPLTNLNFLVAETPRPGVTREPRSLYILPAQGLKPRFRGDVSFMRGRLPIFCPEAPASSQVLNGHSILPMEAPHRLVVFTLG